MKIAVCIKQVPTREWQPRIDDTKRGVREQDASFEMNEPDAYALEEALRLREKHGGEVVVCTAGPARASQVLREALARGADRAIHVEDDRLASIATDSFVVAGALADAVRDEKFDLVLTGLQSDDQGAAQTGVILAERLGLPHATIVMDVQVQEPGVRVKRELEGGWFQWVQMPLPALLTIQSGINQLRYATLKGHHGREEEGDSQGGAGVARRRARVTHRRPRRPAEDEADATDFRARQPRRRRISSRN